MSTITTINASDDLETTSRTNINTNFSNLNTDKLEVGGANGTPTRGDLLVAKNASPTWEKLALGSAGKFLRSDGTDLVYSTNTIPDTAAAGSILAANTANTLTAITSASGLKVLKNDAGTISWNAVTGTGDSVLATSPTLVTSLLLGSGFVVNWNSGDVTLTHSANTLAFAGAATGYTFDSNIAITIADTANVTGLTITQNDTTNNPNGLTITNAGTGAELVLERTNAGATGPTLDFYHNSASPAANDEIGTINYYSKEDSAAKTLFARVRVLATDVIGTDEDASYTISVLYDGTLRDLWAFDPLNDTTTMGTTAVAAHTIILNTGASGSVRTAGAINLGHASDTTISRVSAGVVAIEGINIVTVSSTDELTNKTLNASVGKGTWTASGTWTLPAFTVGGLLTMAANIQFGENTEIILDTALSADGKYCGITEEGTAGTALAFGDLVYFAAADSRWELADASAASTSGDVKIGMCVLAAAADGNATKILLWGKIRADAAFPSFTIGAPVHISETAGDVVVAAPTTTDSVTRRIGWGNTADELFFCPSNDYYTHT